MMCAPDPGSVAMAPPPRNDSPATAAELAELRTMAANRTPQDVRQILRWSVNEPSVNSHWGTLANLLASRYQLSPPAAARVNSIMNTAIHAALVGAWGAKYRFQRPRPNVLDARVNPEVIPVPDFPAYPSGHSTVGGAAARVLSQFFPADRAVIQALAEDSGLSRLKAGIHYRSDHTGGLAMGRQVADLVLRDMVARDGAPLSYAPRPGSSRVTFPELLAIIDRR